MLDSPVQEKSETQRPRTRFRRIGLVQLVVDHLRQLIDSGEIGIGEKLPTEVSLISDLQVSRSVVREAMSHLQAAGLVQTQHGIGTFVATAPKSESDDLLKLLEQTRAEVRWLKNRVEQLERLQQMADGENHVAEKSCQQQNCSR